MPKRITTPKRKMPGRARMKKGSKEAMEWSRKMRELKQKKAMERKSKISPRKKMSPKKKKSSKKMMREVDEEIITVEGEMDNPEEDMESGTRYTVRRSMMMKPKKMSKKKARKDQDQMKSAPDAWGTTGPVVPPAKRKRRSKKVN